MAELLHGGWPRVFVRIAKHSVVEYLCELDFIAGDTTGAHSQLIDY